MKVFKKLLCLGLYGGLLVMGLYFVFGPHLRAQQITCIQDGGSCPEKYQEELGSWQGKSLLFTDFAQLSQVFAKKWPEVQEVRVSRKLPNQLEVTMSLGEPLYVVELSPQNYWVVSKQGVVIQELSATPSGQVVYTVPEQLSSEFRVGQQVEPHWQEQLQQLKTSLELNHLQTQQILFKTKNELELTLSASTKSVLLLGEAPTSLPKLAAILTAQEKNQLPFLLQVIDLRFKYPVLKADPAATISATANLTTTATVTATSPASRASSSATSRLKR
jgi:cell division septal protein FtsQ